MVQSWRLVPLIFENVGVSEQDLIFNGNWLDGRTVIRANASHQNLSDFLVKIRSG